MAGRKDIAVVKNVLLTIGREMEDKGGGADKVSAYASLINAYCRLLGARRASSKPKHDMYRDGDPEYYNTLTGDQDATE
jgi:hypothetical protein